MARGIGIKGAVFCFLAMLASATAAAAHSTHGAMGPQSRAEVRISVSVMPRFELQADSAARADPKTDYSAIALTGNAPGLRYSSVTHPAESRQSGTKRLLVLIIPD